jgi:hypothetical protein
MSNSFWLAIFTLLLSSSSVAQAGWGSTKRTKAIPEIPMASSVENGQADYATSAAANSSSASEGHADKEFATSYPVTVIKTESTASVIKLKIKKLVHHFSKPSSNRKTSSTTDSTSSVSTP